MKLINTYDEDKHEYIFLGVNNYDDYKEAIVKVDELKQRYGDDNVHCRKYCAGAECLGIGVDIYEKY